MSERYTRHIQLSEVGPAGQQKLSKARILVVGAGGLGCPVLQYLAASGVGNIGIVDHDSVALSNLHRQLLYTEKDIGMNKASCAKQKLGEINSEVLVTAYPYALTAVNCMKIIEAYDIIVDATDNFVSRYLVNDACIILGKPLVFGALHKFEGQVSVFNHDNGPSYRCLFPDPPQAGEVPNCNEIGVLGIVPAIIGMFQANEVLKLILGIGSLLSGKVLFYNVLNHQQKIIKIQRNEDIVSDIQRQKAPVPVKTNDCIVAKTISLRNLDRNDIALWIDVREPGELPQLNAKYIEQIPLSILSSKLDSLSVNKQIIFFCQSGVRSRMAAQLATENALSNCFGLEESVIELEKWLKELV